MEFFSLFLLASVDNFCQLFIYSKLINRKVPLRMLVILPIISIIVYLFFNYWIFVAIMIYFMFVGKRLKKEANNNLLWFYGIYTTFSYAVFGYFINSTILLYIGEKIFDQYMYLISITIAPLFSVLCNVILLRLILPSIRFLEKHLDSWNQYFLFS